MCFGIDTHRINCHSFTANGSFGTMGPVLKHKRAMTVTTMMMTAIFLGGSFNVCLHAPDEHHHFHAHATQSTHGDDCGDTSVHETDQSDTHRHESEHTACCCACHSSPDISPRLVLTPPADRPDRVMANTVFTMSAALPVPYRPPILSI